MYKQVPEPLSPIIVDGTLAPEIILPEQIVAGFRTDSYCSGERALMLAVLEDGIRCFQGAQPCPKDNPRYLTRLAREWIEEEDWDWPFSFANVCDALGIDYSKLRSKLLAWKARQMAMRKAERGKVYHLHLRTTARRSNTMSTRRA